MYDLCIIPDDIYQKYKGRQNDYDKTYSFIGTPENPPPFYVDNDTLPLATMTIPVYPSDSKTPYNRLRVYIPSRTACIEDRCKGKNERQGITNLRLEGDSDILNKVKKIELEVAGYRFDKVFSDGMGCYADDKYTLNFWNTMNGLVIPSMLFSDIHIIIDLSCTITNTDNIKLSFDIVPLQQWNELQEFPIVQHQYFGMYNTAKENNGKYEYLCNFNMPVLEIHMKTEMPIEEAWLKFDTIWKTPLIRDKDNTWSLTFCKSDNGSLGDLTMVPNFSQIDKPVIEMISKDGVDPGNLIVWCKNLNVGFIQHERISQKFSC